MTTALQLSVFDQTLDEVGAVEKLAKLISKLGHMAGRVIDLVRLVDAVSLWTPAEFTCTADAWDAAERMEPNFFKVFLPLHAVALSREPKLSDPSSVLGDELGLRLIYLRRLLADLVENREIERNPWKKRQREQRVLDDLSVAPDVRLVLWKARSLPVLLFMYALERTSDHVHPIVEQALREGIDSMIAFALGMHAVAGKDPVAAPSGLKADDVPKAMDIEAVTERWRVVQDAWSS